MTVKSNIDGEEETTDTMAKRISAAQTEAWKSHRYVDEEDDDAWTTYEQNLFVGTNPGLDESENLLGKVPKLVSALDDGEYLDFISAPRNAAKLSRSKRVRKNRAQGKGKEKAAEGVESDTSSTLSSDSEGEAAAVS
jgi:DNA-directed RNA polymerase-3 subunit RPC5